MPLFTIITINLNNREGLERTIRSVRNQTFRDFEYIIVDGVSNDGSQEVLNDHSDIITKQLIEKDQGVYDAMNKGLKLAEGKYIQFLNSGDELSGEDSLRRISDQMNGSEIIYTDVRVFSRDGEHDLKFPDHLGWRFQLTDMLCHQGIFAARSLFSRTGYFDITFRIYGDYDWLMNAIRKQHATYQHIGEALVRYEAEGMSNTSAKEKQRAEKDAIHDRYFSNLLLMMYRTYRKLNQIFS